MIEYKVLQTLDEMYVAAELQTIYWGSTAESLVPAHMLFTISQVGGHVIAAYDGEKMVGVLVGLLGIDLEAIENALAEKLLIYSKRMVVLPEYRGQGIAAKLKFLQSELSLEQGIHLVRWTFDPMLAPNAHLNLRKLGGISRVYKQNYYGTTDRAGLVTLGTSDRLVLDWEVDKITSDKLGKTLELTLDTYIHRHAKTLLGFDEIVVNATSNVILVEIPLNFNYLLYNDERLARKWQAHIRSVMQYYFDNGYHISDFVRGNYQDMERGFYVFRVPES